MLVGRRGYSQGARQLKADYGLHLRNLQTNLVIVHHSLSILIFAFHKHNSLPLG